MPRKKTLTVVNLDPGSDVGTVVQTAVVTMESMNSTSPYLWCFCKLCGRQTEYAVAVDSLSVFKRLEKGAAKAVPITDAIRAEAQRVADNLVAAYERSLSGDIGVPSPETLLLEHCFIREMQGDFSVKSFRDQVERRARLIEWAKHGDMSAAARLPGPQTGAQRPSKLYCDLHYPGRSDDARRAYQRDRRFVAEYEELLSEFWAQYAGYLRAWNLDDHARVRNAAYHHLRIMKAPTRVLDEIWDFKSVANSRRKSSLSAMSIEDYYKVARADHKRLRQMKYTTDWLEELKEQGTLNQSEVAKRLGIRRQAVSAALKRIRKTE